MNGTVDATDYEHFDYKLYDQEPLQLEEAVRKAAEMRRADPAHVYHVVPADRDMTKFFVDSALVEKVQAERWSRWMGAVMRVLLASRHHG